MRQMALLKERKTIMGTKKLWHMLIQNPKSFGRQRQQPPKTIYHMMVSNLLSL